MNTISFHIKTMPDVEAGKRLYSLNGLADKDIARAMGHMRHQQTGSELQPYHLQRIIAISVIHATPDDVKLESLGNELSTEQELLGLFYATLERTNAALISWGGCRFAIPVIHIRSLLNAVDSPHYWNSSEAINRSRDMSTVYRYGQHTDLSEVLAGETASSVTELRQFAVMLGFSTRLLESEPFDSYIYGEIAEIRNSCDLDAVCVFLIYLRFKMIRGRLTDNDYRQQITQLRKSLTVMNAEFLDEF